MRHRDVQQRVDGGTRYRLDVERLHDGAQILLQLLGTAAPAIARGRGPLGVLLEELVDKRHTPVIEMTKNNSRTARRGLQGLRAQLQLLLT